PARRVLVAARPAPRLSEELERAGDPGGGRGRVGLRRQGGVLERAERLREPRRARAREEVADARLDGAEHALAFAPAGLAPERAEARELDRVADRRARRVTLDQVHVLRLPAGLL